MQATYTAEQIAAATVAMRRRDPNAQNLYAIKTDNGATVATVTAASRARALKAYWAGGGFMVAVTAERIA